MDAGRTLVDVRLACGRVYSGKPETTRKLVDVHKRVCKICPKEDGSTTDPRHIGLDKVPARTEKRSDPMKGIGKWIGVA